jgi:hypothetical protein
MERLTNDENEAADHNILIRVLVPPEFLRFSVEAITARRGYILSIGPENPPHGPMIVRARLPLEEYDSLQKEVDDQEIRGGKIEKESQP